MKEAVIQSLQNLRANKLRSFLTMFGILWGMISVVVLSATGEGFRRGNEKVLLELGKNIAIVWGGRTSLQAGGERAGRQITLTLDDARTLAVGLVDDCRRQPRARTAGGEGQERLQRGDGPGQRHRASVSGDSDYRAGVRAELHVDGRRAGRARRHRRLRHGRAVVRPAAHPRRAADAERHAVYGHRQDSQEEAGQQLQRSRQQQDLRALCRDDARHAADRRGAGRALRHHCRAERRCGRGAAGDARRAHRPDRGHRLAAPAEHPDAPRATARLRSGRQAGVGGVGYLAPDADVRPHDQPHEALLLHRRRRDVDARRHWRHEHHADCGEGTDA